jgi:hypothetical protein
MRWKLGDQGLVCVRLAHENLMNREMGELGVDGILLRCDGDASATRAARMLVVGLVGRLGGRRSASGEIVSGRVGCGRLSR